MIRQLVISILLFSCLINTTASKAPIPNPNCTTMCGNVSIPFPFGIGEGCYVDKWFEVVCENSITSPPPKLKHFDLEVMRIDLYDGTLDVRFPITSWNSSGGTTPQESRSLKESPFAFAEDKNKFIAVGCEGHATISSVIYSDKPIVAGCSFMCDKNVSVDTRCYGVNCCMTSIPSKLQVFNARFNINSSCDRRYAFLVKETWFSQSVRNLSALSEKKDVPVVLNWGLDASKHGDSVNSAESSPPSRYCNNRSNTFTASLFSPPGQLVCYCKDGFEGNPYLPRGCDDIDECKPGGSKRPCGEYAICKNTIGSYKCEPNCTNLKCKNLGVPLAIVSSVAAMLLVPASRESYRLVKNIINMRRKAEFFIQNGGKLLEPLYWGAVDNVLFDLEELEKATDGFKTDRVLDPEGQGTVYKGMLGDGNNVTVEESEIVDESKVEEFIKEVVNRLKVDHKNVVKLLGTCLEKKRPLLVYEYVPNGTLHHYIYDEQEEFPLTWEIRLRIATEIAEALSHLHSLDMLSTYHRDITSKNILLDGKYRAKLADIGTSRTVATDDVATDDDTDLTTAVQGTFDLADTGTSRSIATDDQTDLTTAIQGTFDLADTGTSRSIATDDQTDLTTAEHGPSGLADTGTSRSIATDDQTDLTIVEHGPSGLADTGTSRSIATDDQTDLTTAGHGTSGNLDPEDFHSSQSTKMSDVYGFGVVLVELLVGKKLVSIQRSKQGTSPVTYFMQTMEEKKLFDIVDARVKKEGKKASITEFAELAKRCLNSNAKKRPAMKKVADELEKIRKSEIKASDAHDEQCSEEVEPETLVAPAVELFSSISSELL